MSHKADLRWVCDCGSEAQETETVYLAEDPAARIENSKTKRNAYQHSARKEGDHETSIKVENREKVSTLGMWDDHEAKVIHGIVTDFSFNRGQREGEVSLRSLHGDEYEAYIPGKSVANWMLQHWFDHTPSVSDYPFENPSAVPRRSQTKPRHFRIVPSRHEEYEWELFGIVGENYSTTDVDKVAEMVQDIWSDAETRMHRLPSGKHGGILSIPLLQSGETSLRIEVDAGSKDGKEPLRFTLGLTLLPSASRVHLQPSGKPKGIPPVDASVSIRHMETSLRRIRDALETMEKAAEAAPGLLAEARDRDLSVDEVEAILAYYHDKSRISGRTKGILLDLWNDEAITDGMTLYDFAAVLGYAGTHAHVIRERHDVDWSSGVREEVRRLGGEILLVAPEYEEYRAEVIAEEAVA